MVEYNIAAQKFYERQDFILSNIKTDHYDIYNKKYSSYSLIKYLKGAKKPKEYSE